MVSIKDIEDCLEIVAKLCEAYGEEYWATFEVLDKALINRTTLSERIKDRVSQRI